MIQLNGRDYCLCLLDTNVVSEMAKNQRGEFEAYSNWAFSSSEPFLPAVSPFTFVELRRHSGVYDKFLTAFRGVPCIVLKGDFLDEELAAYPEPMAVDPVLVGCSAVNRSLGDVLKRAFSGTDTVSNEAAWIAGRKDIVEGIVSLVKNYPPAAESYSSKEIRTFLEITVFQQVARPPVPKFVHQRICASRLCTGI